VFSFAVVERRLKSMKTKSTSDADGRRQQTVMLLPTSTLSHTEDSAGYAKLKRTNKLLFRLYGAINLRDRRERGKHDLTFRDIETNVRHCISNASTFTAPVTGTYKFLLLATFQSHGIDDLSILLISKQDPSNSKVFASCPKDQDTCLMKNVILNLKAFDRVKVVKTVVIRSDSPSFRIDMDAQEKSEFIGWQMIL